MVNKFITSYFSFLLLTICYLLFAPPIYALYDPASVPNNKMGVHIMSPSELETASALVNSQGGSWGYITVPMQPIDRDLEKWQTFMQQAKAKQLIPIIRITTIPQGGTWDAAADTDLVDFANFLNSLEWPTKNRYIILFNEVNQSKEWGGSVNPAKYADIIKNARAIFKERSDDFFLLGPALDDSLPDSSTSMSAKKYMRQMYNHDSAIWSYFDGFATHSYPNPGFSQPPRKNSFPGITSYSYLFSEYKLADKPVFITETGWDQNKVADSKLSTYWQSAWDIWNQDQRVVAVTPFVLEGGEAYSNLSLRKNGNLTASGSILTNLPKTAGSPELSPSISKKIESETSHVSNVHAQQYKQGLALHKLENIFRIILGLPVKSLITLGQQDMVVELAQSPKQWETGLSSRKDLNGIDGMLFIFPQYHVPLFWMKDTLIPLDMIWIKDNQITEITKNVPVNNTSNPPTYSPKLPIDMVLEVPAGWSDANNLQVGDQLQIN